MLCLAAEAVVVVVVVLSSPLGDSAIAVVVFDSCTLLPENT